MGSASRETRNIGWFSLKKTGRTSSRTLTAAQERELGRAVRAARDAFWCSAFADSSVVTALQTEPNLTDKVLQASDNEELAAVLSGRAIADTKAADDTASGSADGVTDTLARYQRFAALDQDHKIMRRVAERFPEKLALRSALRKLDVARNRFIEANLGLVHSIAYKLSGHGLDATDLVQEGMFGLMKAVDRFDPERGFRFSTYAAWWIRYTTRKALQEQSCDVRRPSRLIQSHAKVQRVRAKLLAKGELSEEAVLEQTGLSADGLRQVEQFGATRWDSFEQPLLGTGEKSLHDTIASNAAPSDDLVDGSRRDRELLNRLQRLGPRQLDIIERRFGLKGDEPMSLQEIADQYSVSRERIRQLQNKALDYIRTTYVRSGVREMSYA